MESRSINRYNSFLNSLNNLKSARTRDLTDDFVVSGTIQKFNLTFDIAWKVMKDIIINHYKVLDFATGSPLETLRIAASVKLIDDDTWMTMLDERNAFAHDYDGELAKDGVNHIINIYLPLFEKLNVQINTIGVYK